MMRASILIVLIFILGCSVYAQEGVVLDIPSSAPIIINKYDDKVEYAGSLPKKIFPFMKLDIFGWYGLKKEYDTELKQKVFLETEEGKRLLKELKEMRQKVMTSKAYFIHAMTGLNKGKYDLATKTFNIKFKPDFPAISGYMHFPAVVVKCNLPVKQEPYVTPASYKTITPPYNYYNIIKLPMSEQTALLIENNISQLEFVLEFKIEQYKDPAWYINYFQGTAINMYIIDKDSHEIYYAVDKSRLKVLKGQQEKIRQEKLQREKEQEEQKRLEKLKKEENVKKIFSSVDEVAIKSKVTNYFNNEYIEKIKTYKGKLDTLKLGYTGEVNVMIGGDSLGVDVIKIEHENENENENEKVILNDWIRSSKYYCTLEGIDYYEFQGKIFCLKKLNIKTHSFEYGFGGLKNKGKKFTFYRNVPDLVKKACEQNFSQRGEHFFII